MITIINSCETTTPGPNDEIGKTLGFSGEDYANSIEPTSDGGFFITGFTNSIRTNYDIFAIKTDKKNNIQWSKTFGGNFFDYGSKGIETKDGGYVVLGTIYMEPGNTDILAVKTDKYGKMLWSRHFGGTKNDEGRSLVELPDGGLAIAGNSNSYGHGGYDILLIKIDAQGHLKWIKSYGGTENDKAFDIKNTFDGKLIVTGVTPASGPDFTDTFLLKVDGNGNQLWFERYDAEGRDDEGHSVVETLDGGFLTVGRYNYDIFSGGYQAYAVKTTANGSRIWSVLIGFTASDETYSVVQSRDGNYILTGQTYLNGTNYDLQLLLVKIDNSGNIIWTKTYGGLKDEAGYDIKRSLDGYVVTGYTFSFGHGSSDIFILHVDENGELQ